MLVRFIKNWTLPLAMLAGTLGYFFFADIPFCLLYTSQLVALEVF